LRLVKRPALEEVLAYCDEDPIERVFLADVARRGLGRFAALRDGDRLTALCHVGANVVPSGVETSRFAALAARSRPRMLIGEERAVTELWEAAREELPAPRDDRPGQPVFVIDEPPAESPTGLRAARPDDLDLLLPACAATHHEELGVDPLRRDPDGFRRRTAAQIQEGRSWLWVEDGTILFKAEASAWTPSAVQLQQVWVDPAVRQRGNGRRGLGALCRLLLERTPTVCLFVRPENEPAIRLYETIGMCQVGTYRSLLF
jgi:RimJ/RimL family protein N-acetyltransferase